MAKEVMTIRCAPELMKRVDALADRMGMSRSEVAERCIAFGVDEGEAFAARLENPVVRQLLRLAMRFDGDPEQLALFDRLSDELSDGRKKRSGRHGGLAGA